MRITPKNYGFQQRSHTMDIAHPAEKIFPLLCPVLEYDWIATWQCELIHTESGVAEEGCVFRTELPGLGRSSWICTHHEPSSLVEYTIFVNAGFFRRLRITLEPYEGGCRVLWTHTNTAVNAKGAAAMDGVSMEEYVGIMTYLEDSLIHYLDTGTCLPAPETSAGHGSLLSNLHRRLAHGHVHRR